MHGGTGDDQVTHAGQSRKGFSAAAQGHAQAGDLRQAAGHQGGLGIVAEAHAVTDPGTEGDDVF